MWDLLFNWSGLLERGLDVTVYAVMALLGTGLFIIRLLLASFGGDADSDFDLDVADSDASFSFFSLLSILAFFMGAGWTGLACRLDWGLGRAVSTLLATGLGFGMMALASGMMYGVRKLNRHIEYDLQTAVGRTARVYLTIPAKGGGHGQVEVSVSGRKKILKAQSTGPELAAFSDAKILEVRDDDTLVVEPLS
ncbi:MAG: hypothetical protein GY716_12660 [bacterium]|nr:hypothetical protein [bacterium]